MDRRGREQGNKGGMAQFSDQILDEATGLNGKSEVAVWQRNKWPLSGGAPGLHLPWHLPVTRRVCSVLQTPWAHLDLDGAWPTQPPGWQHVDARRWGPRLRFCAPAAEMEDFAAACLEPMSEIRFVVYGSGDFHHLSALLVRRITQPLTLVSFDNHPDWDIRPPRWCCGNWINRALDLAQVEQVAVWGCGNFECWGWHRMWGNHRDVRSGRLAVHPWADDRSAADRARPAAITRANWRERFTAFAKKLAGESVYVTIDLDGLQAGQAVTNWENGRFTCEDVCWALDELTREANIIAGDVCGAYSPPAYARRFQRFASETDHPKLPVVDREQAARINLATLTALWPHLTATQTKGDR